MKFIRGLRNQYMKRAYKELPMKTTKSLLVAIAAFTMLFTSCSKQVGTPFQVYFLSTDQDFPLETRVISNSNYIGDVQRIGSEQISMLSEIPPGLRTSEDKISIKLVDNSTAELSKITFSLLPDGTYKKVSSTGLMSYEVKTIDKYKFAILYKKVQ